MRAFDDLEEGRLIGRTCDGDSADGPYPGRTNEQGTKFLHRNRTAVVELMYRATPLQHRGERLSARVDRCVRAELEAIESAARDRECNLQVTES